MTFDGLSRLAFAALSAGLDWLTARALRAGNAFIAFASRRGVAAPLAAAGADLCLCVADMLLRASDRAAAAAFPKARA